MKVCVYGAGAIGSLIAALLSASGVQPSVVARGRTLELLQEQGVGLTYSDEAPVFYPVKAVAKPKELGEQDLIVIATKQHSLDEVVRSLGPLMSDGTQVVLAMNGVPWWFLDGLDNAPSDPVLRSLDPNEDLREIVPSCRVIGCVLHLSAVMVEPGVVRLNSGNSMVLGLPSGELSASLLQAARLLRHAGLKVRVSADIHSEIWFKLLGNMTINPVSALTRATTNRILDDEQVNRFCCRVMGEAAEIGAALGCVIKQTPEERNAITRKLGVFKTSMLQDVEAGKALEYEALIGAVHELACKMGMKVPFIEALYGLTRLLDKSISKNT